MRKPITSGHTNHIKYVENGHIYISKTYNGFNHLLDYRELSKFSFVPKLIANDDKQTVWEYIEGRTGRGFSAQELTFLAKHLRELHKSDIKLPPNNMRRRVNAYLKIINEKNIRVPAINMHFIRAQRILTDMRRYNPCHNDVWNENIIRTSDHRLFLIDWEYATMGDKHFDLAFFIESERLTPEQEAVFLEAYNSVDGEESYFARPLFLHKFLVNYITLCWAYAQEKMPFDITAIEKYLVNFDFSKLPK